MTKDELHILFSKRHVNLMSGFVPNIYDITVVDRIIKKHKSFNAKYLNSHLAYLSLKRTSLCDDHWEIGRSVIALDLKARQYLIELDFDIVKFILPIIKKLLDDLKIINVNWYYDNLTTKYEFLSTDSVNTLVF